MANRERIAPGDMPAHPGQKRLILALGVLLAFSVGLLTGVLLCANLAKSAPADPTAPSDPVISANSQTEPTDEPSTEQTTEPTLEPTTGHTTEPTTESTTEPATEPASEPTAEPATEPTTPPATEPPATQPQSPDKDIDYYILPDSDSRVITNADLAGMNHWTLTLARNEIFARHGYMFKNPDLQNYFNRCTWYTPVYPQGTFDYGLMSTLEAENVKTILAYDEANGG